MTIYANTAIPSSVKVVYTKEYCKRKPTDPVEDPQTEKVVLSYDLPIAYGVGHPGAKIFHDTAPAVFADFSHTTADNLTDLQALTQQIALDYYAWRLPGFDVAYQGVRPLEPNGYNDWIEYAYVEGDQTTTRACSKPWNNDAEEMMHDVCLECPPVSSSSSSSSTSSCMGYSGKLSFVTDILCSAGKIIVYKSTHTYVCGQLASSTDPAASGSDRGCCGCTSG